MFSRYLLQFIRVHVHTCNSLQSKKEGKDQESIQSSTTLAQATNGKVTNSQLDTTHESQEVSPFPAGDHKAHINRRAQRHSKHKTEKNW